MICMVVKERFERLCLRQEFQFMSQQSDLPSLGGLLCLSVSYVGRRSSCEVRYAAVKDCHDLSC